jgi:hemolysin activation/secretion protein
VRVRIIEGSITELVLTGDGTEQFGVRPLLNPVLSERPSRLATLERQLLLINTRPGVRITDSQLEEIGGTSGHFRLIVQLKTWHVYAYVGLDNLGSASIGPWQTYATGAFNSYVLPGDSLVLNLSAIANDPRELGFGRLSYDVPVGVAAFGLVPPRSIAMRARATTGASPTTPPEPSRSRFTAQSYRCCRSSRAWC